jgi:hypothetical protein
MLMRRLVLALLILEIIQYVYFSYQIDQIKEKISSNAATANQRAQATVTVYLQTQEQIDTLKTKIASLSSYLK